MTLLDWVAIGLMALTAIDLTYIAALIRFNDLKDSVEVDREEAAAAELTRLERELADHGSFGRNLADRELTR